MVKKKLILSGIFALMLLAAIQSVAEEKPPVEKCRQKIHEIRFGILSHDVDRLWSGSRKESGVDTNLEILFLRPTFSLGAGVVRPNLGFSLNDRNQTSKLYAGGLWEIRSQFGAFLNLGLGMAVHDGALRIDGSGKKPLGARVLFRVPIEVGVVLGRHHRLSLAFDHVSNAYLATPNNGMDTLGFRYGYIF
ncbi:MAG: acyloxyacyl hydrolase [Desulfobacterales bacterium]|nr:acyloxyacyl hydrolase [Desulfobacterales bacterium]